MSLEEYFGYEPGDLRMKMVRGDTFKRKLFQAAEYIDPDDPDQGTFPVDIRGYDYIFEIRRSPFESETEEPALLTAGMDYFLFGQSDEAVQYDIDEGNASGTTFDELHIEIPDEMTKIEFGTWWWGVRAEQNITDVVETILQAKIKVIADVPRFPGGLL